MTDIIFAYNHTPKNETELICRKLCLDKLLCDDIACYFTDDTEIIAKRQSVYKNIREEKGLVDSLEGISSALTDLFFSFEQASIGVSGGTNETALSSVCAVNSYIEFIETGYEKLRYYNLDAEGLKSFFEFIKTEKESESFSLLKKNAEQNKVNVRNIKSVTVVRMEVPCCGGIERAVKQAFMASGKFIPWSVVTISTDGRILDM